ncbi:MAG: 2-phosphosulfolactate phosphatase [Bacteroidota bacterium]
MSFPYLDLTSCHSAAGLVIVIDVIRAFTSAAFIFGQGAQQIIPVGTVEEALDLKRRIPGALACGEVKGLPPPGFDFGNSPTQALTLDLAGRTVIQRTSAGTQGVVGSTRAGQMLVASFVVAAATVRYIRLLAPAAVSFVVTGRRAAGGDEDLACAEYLAACLDGQTPDPGPYLDRVRRCPDAQLILDPARPEFPETDLLHCTSLDRFDFAMPVSRENGYHVIRKVHP